MKLVKLWEADIEKAYELQCSFKENENGFINSAFGFSFDEFKEYVAKCYAYSLGKELPCGYVPASVYLLLDGEDYIGIFNLRHELNDALKNGAGHIGYGVSEKFRGQGYATAGLGLMIEEAKRIISDDEIYMSVNKNNPASLRVQEKNGAYIHHEDGDHFYTRIKNKNSVKN